MADAERIGAKGYSVERITHDMADAFLQRNHYLAQQGHGFMSKANYGLFNSEDKLIGVVTFSGISVVETLIGAFEGFERDSDQEGFFELSRLSMNDAAKEKNLTSWFLSRCIKRLRKEFQVRAIISYADSRYHHGYIYQATNWGYYGFAPKKSDFFYTDRGGGKKDNYGAAVPKGKTASGANEAESIAICWFTIRHCASSGSANHTRREIMTNIRFHKTSHIRLHSLIFSEV